MTTQKVSVTLEGGAVERARRLAGPRGLSSYLDGALREKLDRDARRQALLSYFDELEAVDPTSDDERRRAALRSSEIRRRASG